MNILYLVNHLFYSGGMESITTNKIDKLVERGHTVTVIIQCQEGRPIFFPLPPSVRVIDLDIDYKSINWTSSNYIHKKYRLYKQRLKHKRLLMKYIEEINPDIIVHNRITLYDSFISKLKVKAKKVLEIHSSLTAYMPVNGVYTGEPIATFGLKKVLSPLLMFNRIRYYRNYPKGYEKLVLLSIDACKEWEDIKHKEQKEYIYNFTNIKIEEEPSLNNKQVLILARHDRQKNLLELLDIWNSLDSEYNDWCLIVVGEGPNKEEFRQKVQELKLENRVILKNETRDVIKYYKSSSIFVLTSIYEGLPMALIESQTMGLPIVSYDCPGAIDEIVTDGQNGYLIPMHNKELFKKQLQILMGDEAELKRMAANALKSAKRFNNETIMDQWEDLFHRVVNK